MKIYQIVQSMDKYFFCKGPVNWSIPDVAYAFNIGSVFSGNICWSVKKLVICTAEGRRSVNLKFVTGNLGQ